MNICHNNLSFVLCVSFCSSDDNSELTDWSPGLSDSQTFASNGLEVGFVGSDGQ